MKTSEILLDHIRNNPGCVSSDIYDALKPVEERKNISSLLSDLTKRGIVSREEVFGKDNRKMFKYWTAGENQKPDSYDFDKAVIAKEKESEKENEKRVNEQYFVITDSDPTTSFDSLEKAVKFAKNICTAVNYNSAIVVKTVKTFKRVVTIVEE